MTQDTGRGGRATGAVPSTVLIVGGLLLALLAAIFLFLQLRDDDGAAGTAAPPSAAPTVAAPPTTEDTSETTTDETEDATTARRSAAATTSSSPSPTTTATEQEEGSYGIPSAAPAWIRIATGGVDGAIVPQGLAADGTINPGRNEIIWFTGYNRVSPGQLGTSVIAAHVTWEGAPDAFVNLPSVGIGDTVEIGYADGTSRSFTVNEAYPIDKDDLARSVAVWGDHPGHPRLAIVTCDETQGHEADGHTSANYVLIAEA